MPPVAPDDSPLATAFEQWCALTRRALDEWSWECYRYEVLHIVRDA